LYAHMNNKKKLKNKIKKLKIKKQKKNNSWVYVWRGRRWEEPNNTHNVLKTTFDQLDL
jgi:hypothetical protein